MDWQWITDRYYKRISVWEYRCLSLAGRVILAQSVLNQLAVYWSHLFFLPASIIQSMNKLTANFIWGGQAGKRKFHLSKLSNISLPKNMGGWGVLDLRTFGKALLCRTLWRGIYEERPWSNIIQKKYMRKKDISFWFRKGRIGSPFGSSIWLSLRKIEIYFLENLVWRFHSGKKILIGKDHFLSGFEVIDVPESLLSFFHRKGFFYWDNLIVGWQGSIPIWKEAGCLGLQGDLARQWEIIRTRLRNCGIFHSAHYDSLIWILKRDKLYSSERHIPESLWFKESSSQPFLSSHILEIRVPIQNYFIFMFVFSQ